jgi:hypothetical protein
MGAFQAIFSALVLGIAGIFTWLEVSMGVFGAFLAYMLAKLGKYIALVASTFLLIAALIVCMRAFIATIAAFIVPPGWLLGMIELMVPTHFLLCFSTIIAAKTCRAGFDIAMEKIKLAARAL